MSMRKTRLTLLASAAATLLQACATAGPLPSFEDTKTVDTVATVKALDLQTRRVTLVGQDGKPFSFVASDQVRNLDRVKVGDTVKIQYRESLLVTVKRDGSAPAITESGAVKRAEPGEQPAGTATSAATVSLKIVAVDRATNLVTMLGPDGNYRVLQVRNPKNLENVQVGDVVYATYSESVGVAVEPVAPAAK